MSSPKRLLLIANDFPNPYEPTKGVFNERMARALAADHEIRVLAPVSWVDEVSARLRGQAVARCVRPRHGVSIRYPRYYYTPRLLRRFYATFLWWSLRKTVRHLLAKRPPDAVLGYWAHPDGAVALRAAREAGVPGVIIVGGSDVLLLTRSNGRRRCILRVLNEADAVVAVSRHLKGKLIELGIPAAKVHVVLRGVDDAVFCPGDRGAARRKLGISENQRVLLWVGRMVPVKGVDVLLTACGRLHLQGFRFALYLIGEGPSQSALQAQTRALGLAEDVKFLGAVDHERLADWYRAANLTVLPSRSEGVPNVLRESLACGTPFVASRVGGIPEIANAANSRLVEPDNPERLADAIREALVSGDLGCPVSSDSATWAQSAAKLLEVIASVSQGRPHDWAAEVAARPILWKRWTKQLLTRFLPRRLLLTHGPAHSGAVCLTFDDGPHPEHTPRLLEVLHEQRIKATFFVVGRQAARYPELIRRMAAEGHTVGHHSYTHTRPQCTSAGRLGDEVRRTSELLGCLLGRPPQLFRPPFGQLTAAKLWRLWRARQTVVLWNRDPKDYACPATEVLAQWFRQHPLRSGDLVLLHDDRAHAAAVLPEVADSVRARGLSFGTIAEWLPC